MTKIETIQITRKDVAQGALLSDGSNEPGYFYQRVGDGALIGVVARSDGVFEERVLCRVGDLDGSGKPMSALDIQIVRQQRTNMLQHKLMGELTSRGFATTHSKDKNEPRK